MKKVGLAWALALLIGAGSWLGAAVSARADEVYEIDGEVWDYYQAYLDKISHGQRPGAFAITTDGYGAYYVWCSQTRCVAGRTYGQEAKSFCEQEYGTDCVVFAVRDDIRVQYEIRKASSSTNYAPTPAPAVETIAVTAAVQAEIDRYLSNAKSAGKAWALAIAKDGSAVASASCLTAGGGGYFGGGGTCNLVEGTAQELASREALKRCGGPAKCVLLYAGQQKTASIDIVAR